MCGVRGWSCTLCCVGVHRFSRGLRVRDRHTHTHTHTHTDTHARRASALVRNANPVCTYTYRRESCLLSSAHGPTSTCVCVSRAVDTLNLIKKAPRVKFSGSRWSHISQAAKDCIKAMLEPHPDNRPTAADVSEGIPHTHTHTHTPYGQCRCVDKSAGRFGSALHSVSPQACH